MAKNQYQEKKTKDDPLKNQSSLKYKGHTIYLDKTRDLYGRKAFSTTIRYNDKVKRRYMGNYPKSLAIKRAKYYVDTGEDKIFIKENGKK